MLIPLVRGLGAPDLNRGGVAVKIGVAAVAVKIGETDDAPDADKVRWCVEEIFDGVTVLNLCHAAGTDCESIRPRV